MTCFGAATLAQQGHEQAGHEGEAQGSSWQQGLGVASSGAHHAHLQLQHSARLEATLHAIRAKKLLLYHIELVLQLE